MKFDEYIENQIENPTIEILDERIVPKFVIRNRKRVKKFVSNKPGFKIVFDKNGKRREKKETKSEEIKRKIGAKKGAPKRVKKSLKKRKDSFKARNRYGINYNKNTPAQRTVEDEK